MGRRGPLPKSAELKSIIGSERRKPKENLTGLPKSALQRIAPLKALPPVPLWMIRNEHARVEYLEVGPLLIEAEVLTRANMPLFCAGCLALGNMITGVEKPVQKTPAARKQTSLNLSLLTTYRNMLVEFGLTPTSAIRRGGPEAPVVPEEVKNPFETNKRQAA